MDIKGKIIQKLDLQSGTSKAGNQWKKQEYVLAVQFSRSVMSDSATPWTAACQAFLSFTISWSLLKLKMSNTY